MHSQAGPLTTFRVRPRIRHTYQTDKQKEDIAKLFAFSSAAQKFMPFLEKEHSNMQRLAEV